MPKLRNFHSTSTEDGKESAARIKGVEAQLMKELGREVTLKEVSGATGIAMEEIVMALEANVEVESIYRSVYQADGKETCLADRLPEKGDRNEELLDRMLLGQLLKTLEGMERELIMQRYFQDRTQAQVAAALGISQVQVSRLEKKILLRLRRLAV